MEPVRNGVLTYLRRMIACMGEGILPIMPQALASMLDVTTCQIRGLKEFAPLINQIVAMRKVKVRYETGRYREKSVVTIPQPFNSLWDTDRHAMCRGGTRCLAERLAPGRRLSRRRIVLTESIQTAMAMIMFFFRWNLC